METDITGLILQRFYLLGCDIKLQNCLTFLGIASKELQRQSYVIVYEYWWWDYLHIYSILRCIGNKIHSWVTFSSVVPLHATNTTTNYKILWLSLNFNPIDCRGNLISSDINIDDGIFFQHSIQRCIGSTIYKSATFSRVVPLREPTNKTANYKIVWLSLELLG